MSLQKRLRLISATIIAVLVIFGVISIRSAIEVRQDFIHVTDVTAPQVIGLGGIKVAGGRVMQEALSYTLLHAQNDGEGAGNEPVDKMVKAQARRDFDNAAAEL